MEAINYARDMKLDVVLVDTAGRYSLLMYIIAQVYVSNSLLHFVSYLLSFLF